ncbi:MAG: ATP synthase F1 subunit epsilon [Proteobacteria bacterium]|nr:ATP synthase F1 subunit epsilon [Pseudomonadota bacterium]
MTVDFDVITPSQVLLSDSADMVVAPGSDGDFGVLPGHAPLLTTLRPGVLDVHRGGKVTARIFVGGGFAEVSDNRLTVLAEEARAVSDIDRAWAEERLARALESLEAAGDAKRTRAEAEVRIAEAMVAAAAP